MLLMVNVLVVYLLTISSGSAFVDQALISWYSKASDPRYECQTLTGFGVAEGPSILTVVPCDEPDAIFSYDFKASFTQLYLVLE